MGILNLLKDGKVSCDTSNILLAVGFAVVGSIVSSIGYVIEKKAHIRINRENRELSISNKYLQRNEEKSSDTTVTSKSFVTSKLWCSGFFIYFMGSIFNAAALKFGAQSVVAPLGSLTLVCNTILATKYLNEPCNLNDILGILFIVIGSILAVIFGPKSDCTDPSIYQLKQDYIDTQFLIFFISLTGITIIDFIGTKYLECVNKTNVNISTKQSISEIKVINETSISKKNENERNKLNKLLLDRQESNALILINDETTMRISKYSQLFLLISYVFIAAFFGSINVLLMKSSVIIIYSFNIEYIEQWFFWVIFISIFVVNFLLEYFRQRALKYFAALFVIPIYQVMLVIGSILMGAMYFNEFEHILKHDLIFFILAIIIILVGIFLMAFNFSIQPKNKQEDVNHSKRKNVSAVAKILPP